MHAIGKDMESIGLWTMCVALQLSLYGKVFHAKFCPTRITAVWLSDVLALTASLVGTASGLLRGHYTFAAIMAVLAYLFWHSLKKNGRAKRRLASALAGYKARQVKAGMIKRMHKMPRPVRKLQPNPV